MSRIIKEEVYDWAGIVVQELLRGTRDYATDTVLDVGAGQGKYAHLLPEFTLDACEAWPETISEWQLDQRYRHVYVGEVQQLVRSSQWRDGDLRWDVVIMGDVLEHLTVPDATETLSEFCAHSFEVIAVVPYRYQQGPEHGNPYQRHLQADLTPELMAQRYPTLTLVALETRQHQAFKGVYRRSDA